MSRDLALALQPDRSRYTLPRFLEDVVARHGPRRALSFDGCDTSFDALDRAVAGFARGLVAAGVVKGARVALLMANRPEWVVAAFAVARLGAVLVPVNTFATSGERDYILRHSDASVLLLQRRLLKHAFLDDLRADHPELRAFPAGAARCAALPSLRRLVCLGLEADDAGVEAWESFEERGAGVPDDLLAALADEVTPADDGVLIYTSGTTAHPKGVLHLQRAPVIQAWRFAEDMGLATDDVVLTAQPFFWTAGIAMSLGSSLGAGASLILQESFDAGAVLATIEQERVTTLHAWPHQEKALAEHPTIDERDLSSLTKIEFASPLAARAGLEKDVWGTYGSYGLSETFTLASSLPAATAAELRSATSGKPLAGMHVRIVDPESGAPLSGDAKGEIAVKGATFMRGYYKVEPELYLDDEGYFRTQDGGWFDGDGYLHWTGRLSNLIKTGGANVSPLEIEKALSDREDLHVALAVGVPHPVLGEAIVLCAVPAVGSPLEGALRDPDAAEQALRAQLRERVAAYKVPRRVLFFTADQLRYTGNQKIQLAPLREAALERLRSERAEIDGVVYSTD